MKLLLPPFQSRRARGGWALIIVMMLAVGALLVAGSVLSWSNTAANITARNNEFYATTYAAESATEKILAAVVTDYENYGAPLVYSKLSTYSNYIPTATDDPYWANYTFTGRLRADQFGGGQPDQSDQYRGAGAALRRA